MSEWFVHRDGWRRGPLSFEELSAGIKAGEVWSADLVWTEGMKEPVPVSAFQKNDQQGGSAVHRRPGGHWLVKSIVWTFAFLIAIGAAVGKFVEHNGGMLWSAARMVPAALRTTQTKPNVPTDDGPTVSVWQDGSATYAGYSCVSPCLQNGLGYSFSKYVGTKKAGDCPRDRGIDFYHGCLAWVATQSSAYER